MPMVNRANEGLSVQEAATELGVSYQTLHNWIKADLLPVTRFGPTGRIVRIHPDDLAAMRQGPGEEAPK